MYTAITICDISCKFGSSEIHSNTTFNERHIFPKHSSCRLSTTLDKSRVYYQHPHPKRKTEQCSPTPSWCSMVFQAPDISTTKLFNISKHPFFHVQHPHFWFGLKVNRSTSHPSASKNLSEVTQVSGVRWAPRREFLHRGRRLRRPRATRTPDFTGATPWVFTGELRMKMVNSLWWKGQLIRWRCGFQYKQYYKAMWELKDETLNRGIWRWKLGSVESGSLSSFMYNFWSVREVMMHLPNM